MPEKDYMSEIKIHHPIVIFDGVCNYCSSVVAFIIKRDGRGIFRFAPFQSDAGRALLEKYNVPPDYLDSFVLIDDGRLYTRSEAGLRLWRRLGGVWKFLYVFIAVPAPVRDAVYNFIARNRYKWFGRKDACMVPGPEVRDRFLS